MASPEVVQESFAEKVYRIIFGASEKIEEECSVRTRQGWLRGFASRLTPLETYLKMASKEGSLPQEQCDAALKKLSDLTARFNDIRAKYPGDVDIPQPIKD